MLLVKKRERYYELQVIPCILCLQTETANKNSPPTELLGLAFDQQSGAGSQLMHDPRGLQQGQGMRGKKNPAWRRSHAAQNDDCSIINCTFKRLTD